MEQINIKKHSTLISVVGSIYCDWPGAPVPHKKILENMEVKRFFFLYAVLPEVLEHYRLF